MARYRVKVTVSDDYEGVIDLPDDVTPEDAETYLSDNFSDYKDELMATGGDTVVEACEPEDEDEDDLDAPDDEAEWDA